jgi:flagellar biosynthesis component FlhA
MIKLAAWVISIALVALACRLPRRVLDFLMWLALAVSVAWTLALFTL